MNRTDLSSVDSQRLALGVNNMETVSLTGTKLTARQCEAICKYALGGTKLIKLYMSQNDFLKVNPKTRANLFKTRVKLVQTI